MAENIKVPWPTSEADKVREKAQEEDHDNALDTLEMIRNELFGNADKMESLAVWWGETPALANSKIEIDTSLANLAGYWEGGGYDAYRVYAMDASTTVSDNEGLLNEVASVLEGCISIVYDTYADAIDFIADCAHALVDGRMDAIDAIAEGPLGLVKVGTSNVRTLNDFVNNVADLVADAVRKMGALRENGVFLARQANDYTLLNEIPRPAQNGDMWSVKPVPDDGA